MAHLRTLVLAALLGALLAFASVLFQTAVQDVINLVWDDIPDWLGWSECAALYVVVVPGIAGLLVAATMRLAGARRARFFFFGSHGGGESRWTS